MSIVTDAVSTHAYHLYVQRPDGAGFATTSHDRKHLSGSMTLQPDVDLRLQKLAVNDRLFGSSLELEGAPESLTSLTDNTHSDYWREASVRLSMGDWWQQAEPCTLAAGRLGEITMDEDRLTVSVDLCPDAARDTPCIQTSPECRAMLGDRQCRVDMRPRRLRVSVMAATDDGISVNASDIERFRLGRLRWISGTRCGLEDMIIAIEAGKIFLRDACPSSSMIGDRAILTMGCDGRRSTCSERFGNILNFRGEPDLPGSAIMMRLPGV